MKTKFLKSATALFAIFALASCGSDEVAKVEVYSAPKSEVASTDYRVWVEDQELFCYTGEVYDTRFSEGKYFGDKGLSYSTVSFGQFDFEGKVKVKIQVNRDVTSATIRPISRGVEASVKDNFIEFYIDKPGALTIEPNGEEHRVLHLFANNIQENKPDPADENVIYYGPGEHVVNTISLKDNQTLFVDGGAVLYFDIFEGDPLYRYEERNGEIQLGRYDHGIEAVNAKNIKIKGRGILDFSRATKKCARKNPIHINGCENVEIEGVVIRGANCWHVTLYRSKDILVDNIKEIAFGFNTDGVNTVLCQDVHIKNCFLRQRDDGIVMKSMDTGNKDCFITEVEQPATQTRNVLVEDCVIWSDWGYALGATYEIRMPVDDITFRNCDIIHATHRSIGQGVVGILVADSNNATNIKFENITIERSLKPIIKLEQKITEWTVNKDLGCISDVTISNLKYLEGKENPIIFEGFDQSGKISRVHLNNIEMLGKEIKSIDDWKFKTNDYIEDIYLNDVKLF